MKELLQIAHSHPLGSHWVSQYDDFEGTVIGYYQTREGKQGVVLQQVSSCVVHVYGVKSLLAQKEGK